MKQPTFRKLADLLEGTSARPVVELSRLARSTIYDVGYRTAVVSCAFELHSKAYAGGGRRIHATRLKLLQFVALRPWLLGVVRDWVAAQKEPQLYLLAPRASRRGFLSDETHDKVVELLSAHGALRRQAAFLAAGPEVRILSDLAVKVTNAEVLVEERRILRELLGLRLTNSMMEGK